MPWYCFVGICLFFTSCNKDTADVSVEQIASPTTDIIYNVDIADDGVITMIFGYVWFYSCALYTDQTFSHMRVDTFSTKGQFDLLRMSDGKLATVGTDGFLFTKADTTAHWTFHRLRNWEILHHLIETEDGYIASGGKSYEQGYIYLINKGLYIDTVLYFGHEISEVREISPLKLVSVGYGNIQRSDDGGHTWRLLPNKGDFYASCVFLNENHGFIIGYNGSLLESTDGGNHWSESKATIRHNGFNSFRKLVRTDDDVLFITGNDGQLWRSYDDGKKWLYTRLGTDSDVYDIVQLGDGHYLTVGSNGWIGKVSF